eukprot:NODE_28_length_33831_cov_0.361200.p20 type:complete len:108 gc:universal NODE_28_length_33831_cov_0.361200:16521-16198(-)
MKSILTSFHTICSCRATTINIIILQPPVRNENKLDKDPLSGISDSTGKELNIRLEQLAKQVCEIVFSILNTLIRRSAPHSYGVIRNAGNKTLQLKDMLHVNCKHYAG